MKWSTRLKSLDYDFFNFTQLCTPIFWLGMEVGVSDKNAVCPFQSCSLLLLGGVNWDIEDTANSLEFNSVNQRLIVSYMPCVDQILWIQSSDVPHGCPSEETGTIQIIHWNKGHTKGIYSVRWNYRGHHSQLFLGLGTGQRLSHFGIELVFEAVGQGGEDKDWSHEKPYIITEQYLTRSISD